MDPTPGTGDPARSAGLAQLRWLLDRDDALRSLLAEVRRRMETDPAHDLAHLLRVARWTIVLGGEAVDPRAAVAAALLHDVVNVPKHHPDRGRASELSAAVASELLPLLGFESQVVEEVAEAVRDHSFTPGGRAEAERRASVMLALLRQLGDEIGAPLPVPAGTPEESPL